VKRVSLLLACLALGCAYYNGVYNTKRLASDARRAEKDGRTLEANGLWGRVALQAESTLARHPTNKWADETRLLQGTALVRLKECDRAVPILDKVLASTTDLKMRDEAALLNGDCRESLGDAEGASRVYAQMMDSPDPQRRSLARYQHGRALRTGGDYEEALNVLASSDHPRAAGERAAALAGAGRVPEAMTVSDSLIASHDTLAPWDSILAAIGRKDLEAASHLTDRVIEVFVAAESRAGFLREDGLRWAPADEERAATRFAQAIQLSGKGPAGLNSRLELARMRLRGPNGAQALDQQAEALEQLVEFGGPAGAEAARLAFVTRTVAAARESVTPGAPQGDLRLFLAGELARDSLGAMPLAIELFARVPHDWPESLFAPKALFALAALEPARSDSLIQVVTEHYAESPYLAVLRGEDSPAYRKLEDSLRLFAQAAAIQTRKRPGTQQARPNPTTRQPVEQ
jgi:tetratricopeptide (TPR) repeat protein